MAALSVLGTSSWAGKSLVATALCRWFAREGVSVAPFKAQNMSNNARVVEGGEIGAAQYFQALAAGVEPETRMNPVLLKPETEERSQVILLGQVDAALTATPWRERAPLLRPVVDEALASLLRDFELVVIEGAGSPAEENLADVDLANYCSPEIARPNAVLVADIGRGGAFAHLYGTWALIEPPARSRIGGFVLNRFRGDPGLLGDGPRRLERRTGVPTLGVLPELEHGLPDEDGARLLDAPRGAERVAVVRYPAASNLDEFQLLSQVVQVSWAREPADLEGASLIVLPGSKEPVGDLRWLRARGMDETVVSAAARGRRVLGICGGLQMLGAELDGEPALGLLPIATRFAEAKLTRRRRSRFGPLGEEWEALSGREVAGYEIRQGRSIPTGEAREALAEGLGYHGASVLGVYLHGLLEDPALVESLFGARPALSLEDTFEVLADAISRHLAMDRVRALATLGPAAVPPERPAAIPAGAAPRSLVLLNTGHGKGKSTAAFGVLLRAVARRGWRACVVQFVKSDRWKVGEEESARGLGVEWVKGGDGFSWESRDLATSEELAADAWRLARATIEAGEHQLVVLDEITYPINWGWIDGDEVASVIRRRPERVNVIATGRNAPPVLVDVADTVTEMVKIRHAYDRGIKARRGLDF
jgi:adenosylcobyric acid synthase